MTYKIVSKPGCPHCDRAKAALKERGIPFYEDLRDTPEKIANFKSEGYLTFPQVWDGYRHIGGADDLLAHLTPSEGDNF